MANRRVFGRIEVIISEQFKAGDEFNSEELHSKLFNKHGITYLPNRVAVAVIAKRSKLVEIISKPGERIVFRKLGPTGSTRKV